jgi:hypothetical protein
MRLLIEITRSHAAPAVPERPANGPHDEDEAEIGANSVAGFDPARLNPKLTATQASANLAIAFKCMVRLPGVAWKREPDSALGESVRPAEQRLP